MEFEQGKLDFLRVDAKINRRLKSKPMFLFEGEYYSSEYLAVEYFKSQGYDAFFSENTTWKNMLKILFKDIFRKFERMARKKHYKKNFYDNEFFKDCEDEINQRFDYLKTADLKSIIENHSVRQWIKYRILVICSHIPKGKILAVLYDMIQDYAHNHIGFPDLFVFNDNEFFFCEVKANSDVLNAVQVRKHEVMMNFGIDMCIFGINKKSSWISEEKDKYFNENFIDEENFVEVYDYKMKIADMIYNRFRGNQIEDIKSDLLDKYDSDAFIGFLNVVSSQNQLEVSDKIINKSIKEGKRIKDLRHLAKGMYFEERGLYSDAIGEYLQVETFERYERLYECYRRGKDGESQVNLIYHVLNDAEHVPSKVRTDFKRRANRLFRNKRSITTYRTDRICPICGSDVKLTNLHKRNNISIFTCTNGGCYWYGGIYAGDLRQYSKAGHLEKANADYSILEIDVDNLSYDEKVRLKRKIVKQGNGYIDRGENANAISFYNRLLTHPLFANDYHPYRKLARLYRKERQYKKEVEIIVSFFNSGIYCDDTQLNWFLKKLNQLAKYGNIEHSKITDLEMKFSNNGARNMELSNEPVPQAIRLKRTRKKF